MLQLEIGNRTFAVELREDRTPTSVETVREFLPLELELMHVRWSGTATWVNIDEIDLLEIPRKSHAVYPSWGNLLLYPSYRSEQGILAPCGLTCFKSPAGELTGNHFVAIDAAAEELKAIGELTLREGVQDVVIQEVSE